MYVLYIQPRKHGAQGPLRNEVDELTMLRVAEINPHLGRRVIGIVDAAQHGHPLHPAVPRLLDIDIGLFLELVSLTKPEDGS